jgi:hypothetical protein
LEEIGKRVRALSMVVYVGGSAKVSRIGEGLEDSGGSGTGHRSCIHLPKDHSSGFDEAEGCVYSKKFARGAGCESISIIHAKPVRAPIQGIAGKFRKFIGAVGSSWKGFLELVIGHPVIPAHPDPALSYIHILGGVGWGFSDDVWARGGGRFGKGVKTAI